MNIAMGIGILLVGGWVLNSPGDEVVQNAAQEPAATTAPIVPSEQGTRRLPPPQAQATQPGNEQYRRNPESALPGVPSEHRRAARLQTGGGAALPDNMPVVPTEVDSSSGGRLSGWMPPTSTGQMLRSGRIGAAANRDSSTNVAWARMPVSPTSRSIGSAAAGLAATPRYAVSPGSSGTYATSGYATSASASAAPQSLPEKPFSAYRSMPGVSPYLNLFRNDTSLGTIDNYTTIVRPELEQRYFNQQIRRDVRGLERDSRAQGAALQQMGVPRSPQGIATPQYYLNYGNYFPSGSTEISP
jgi:hypothetical protein